MCRLLLNDIKAACTLLIALDTDKEKAIRKYPDGFKYGSPSWARTSDLRINSPSLYRLSYQGMIAALYSTAKICQSVFVMPRRNVRDKRSSARQTAPVLPIGFLPTK